MYWNWTLSLKLEGTEWWWLHSRAHFLNTGLWCLFGLSTTAVSFGMPLHKISVNMAEPCPGNAHPSAILLVSFTGFVFFVYMVALDEPLSSRQYDLLSLPSLRDAGGLKEQLLRDSWQTILPLALWLKAHDCVTHPLGGWYVACLQILATLERCWVLTTIQQDPLGDLCEECHIFSASNKLLAWPGGKCNSSHQSLEGQLKRWQSQTLLGGGRWPNKSQISQTVARDVGKNFIMGKMCSPGEDH